MTIDIIDADLVVERSEVEDSIARAVSHLNGFWTEVKWQIENRAWEVLELDSFNTLWNERYAVLKVGISKAERPELVTALRAIGQTQQQIADKLNVSVGTVNAEVNFKNENDRDPNRNFPDDSPAEAITNSRGQERPASYAPRGVDPETGEILNTPPAPTKPRAEAIASQFTSAVVDLNRVLDKFHRIATSDNFNRNKKQVAALHGNDLNRAISELQNVADQLH